MIKPHNRKHLLSIKSFMQEYIEEKISLVTMQCFIGAVHNNFENDIDPKILENIWIFVNDLEVIRFMLDQEKHYEAVSNKISDLSSFLEKYIQ